MSRTLLLLLLLGLALVASTAPTTKCTTTRRTAHHTTRQTTAAARVTTTTPCRTTTKTTTRATTTRATTTTTARVASTTTATGGSTSGMADVDIAILNFALNLEYLEAEFYLAAIGRKPSYDGQVKGNVTGGQAVNFTSQAMKDYATEIAQDEENHVVFLRKVLGSNAVDRPNINIGGGPNGSFGIAAAAAGKLAGLNNATQQALATFSPYANELFFLHGAFIFEDVGVTAYKGASPLVTNRTYLEAAAGILAVEAYHAATVRTLLYASRDTVAVPAGAVGNSSQLRVSDIVGAISNLRAALGNGKDQSIVLNNASNIVPTDSNSVAFSRTPREVLNIVYGAVNATKGLFFPNGLNGNFTALLK